MDAFDHYCKTFGYPPANPTFLVNFAKRHGFAGITYKTARNLLNNIDSADEEDNIDTSIANNITHSSLDLKYPKLINEMVTNEEKLSDINENDSVDSNINNTNDDNNNIVKLRKESLFENNGDGYLSSNNTKIKSLTNWINQIDFILDYWCRFECNNLYLICDLAKLIVKFTGYQWKTKFHYCNKSNNLHLNNYDTIVTCVNGGSKINYSTIMLKNWIFDNKYFNKYKYYNSKKLLIEIYTFNIKRTVFKNISIGIISKNEFENCIRILVKKDKIFSNIWRKMWKEKLGNIGGSYGFDGTFYTIKKQLNFLQKQMFLTESSQIKCNVFAPIKSGDIIKLKCIYDTQNQNCQIYVKHENKRLIDFNANNWQLLAKHVSPPITPAVSLCESDDCVQII